MQSYNLLYIKLFYKGINSVLGGSGLGWRTQRHGFDRFPSKVCVKIVFRNYIKWSEK